MPGLVIAALLLCQEAKAPHVFRGLLDWRQRVDAIRAEPASSTGKQLYIAFLKRRYGYQIAAVNDAYGTDASAFTELESSTFSGVSRAKLLPDDLAFAVELLAAEAEDFRKSKGREAVAAVNRDTPADLRKAVAKWLPCIDFTH